MEESAAHPHDGQTATESEQQLILTESAAQKAQEAMQREGLVDHALRVAVVGGGCSGFQYNLSFDSTPRPDDTVLEQHGIRLLYLRGTMIDYVNGLHGAGFKFVNPNANRTCGCGSSFSA
jgi:iron-sulfur cluster assembly accessory protein